METNKLLEKYPPNMSVKDISEFLGVSESTAYGIIKQSDFPKLTIEGSRKKIIPKHYFCLWYEKNICT